MIVLCLQQGGLNFDDQRRIEASIDRWCVYLPRDISYDVCLAGCDAAIDGF